MNEESYIVIEGTHKNPNRIETLLEKSKKIYGPFSKSKAEEFAKSLIQKNVDNFYHRAWVIKMNARLDKVCEECNQEKEDVISNLMILGFKICGSCKLSKTIFPV